MAKFIKIHNNILTHVYVHLTMPLKWLKGQSSMSVKASQGSVMVSECSLKERCELLSESAVMV